MSWKIKELTFFDTYLVTNGKSIFEEGYESKFVTAAEALELGISQIEIDFFQDTQHMMESFCKARLQKPDEQRETPYQPPNKAERLAMNKLAREQFKYRMVKDISFDLQVCAIEGLDPTEYIEDLKGTLQDLLRKFHAHKKAATTQIEMF